MAVIGGIGTYHLFASGEELFLPLGAALGALAVVAGAHGVWAIVQGIRILRGADLTILDGGRPPTPPPPPLPSHAPSQPSLFQLSLSL
ncbi:hypothetical protein [Salinibacter altiplanensis]|uniref:hypothetical protein n=1 Tax=Salinibacter altiplanensis TaxID=1803181 RepID=UPI00131A00FD|nr:hypothetical protein [Salinibacter altiplanensis]